MIGLVLTNVTNRQCCTWEATGSSPGILAERDGRPSRTEAGARLELLGTSSELRDIKTSSTLSSRTSASWWHTYSSTDLRQINENAGFMSFSCVPEVFPGAVLVLRKLRVVEKCKSNQHTPNHPVSTLLLLSHLLPGFLFQ